MSQDPKSEDLEITAQPIFDAEKKGGPLHGKRFNTFRLFEGLKVRARDKETGRIDMGDDDWWTVVGVTGTPEQPTRLRLKREKRNADGLMQIEQMELDEPEVEELQRLNLGLAQEGSILEESS